MIEKRLPGGRNAQVGVPVVVPIVVDVEAVGVEIADVHAVAVRVEKFVRPHLWHQTLRFTEGLAPHSYSLSILNVFREQPPMRLGNISARAGQEVQNLYPLRALPEPVGAGILASLEARHPARPNRSPTFISKIMKW